MRNIEREKKRLETEEKKMKAEIKKMATNNQHVFNTQIFFIFEFRKYNQTFHFLILFFTIQITESSENACEGHCTSKHSNR